MFVKKAYFEIFGNIVKGALIVASQNVNKRKLTFALPFTLIRKRQVLHLCHSISVAYLVQKIFAADVASKSLLSLPHWGRFWGVVCLENNKVNQQMNVTMDTSSIRTTNS